MTESIFNGQCARECIHVPGSPLGRMADPETSIIGDVTLSPEGTLGYVAYGGCGVKAGFVGGEIIAKKAPTVIERIGHCNGPVTKEISVPRRITGKLFGLTKTVQVAECGAITQKELFEIAMAEREGRL